IVSDDGLQIAAIEQSGPVHFIDAAHQRRPLSARGPDVRDVRWLDDGAFDVLGDNEVRRYRPRTTVLGERMVAGDASETALVAIDDGGHVFHSVRGGETIVLGMHSLAQECAISADGNTVVTSGGRRVIAWRVRGHARREIETYYNATPNLALTDDGSMLAL